MVFWIARNKCHSYCNGTITAFKLLSFFIETLDIGKRSELIFYLKKKKFFWLKHRLKWVVQSDFILIHNNIYIYCQ